jgi:hypothetical protein
MCPPTSPQWFGSEISGGEMKRAISASDIVPNYDESSGIHEEDEDDTADVTDDLTYDLCNLISCDYHTLRFELATREEVIHETATRATQLLINRFVHHLTSLCLTSVLKIVPYQIISIAN